MTVFYFPTRHFIGFRSSFFLRRTKEFPGEVKEAPSGGLASRNVIVHTWFLVNE